MPSRRVLPALLMTLLLVTTACAQVTGTRSPTVAASVDGTDIAVSEVEAQFDALADIPDFAANLEAQEGFSEQVEAVLLSLLIQREIFERGAADFDVEIDDDAVEEQVAAQAGGIEDEDELREALAAQGITPEFMRLQSELQLYQERVGDELAAEGDGVSDEQMQAAYDELYGDAPAARHILLDSEEEAEAALERLDDGEDFGEVALDESTDPSVEENEGELGPIIEGPFDQDVAEAVYAAEDGEIVGPVETQFGFHVIERLAPPPMEEVEDEVRDAAEGDAELFAINAWVAERLEETDVVVNPRFGTWNAEQGAVQPSDALDQPSELER